MSWSPWVWVGIFAVIVGGGAVVLALLVRRLWRQAKELSAELERVLVKADELSELLATASADSAASLAGAASAAAEAAEAAGWRATSAQ